MVLDQHRGMAERHPAYPGAAVDGERIEGFHSRGAQQGDSHFRRLHRQDEEGDQQ